MALKVRVTPRAKRDIAEIRSYILGHDRQAAERVRIRIAYAIDLLAKHALMGPVSDEPGVRIKLVTPYPFRIYYRIRSGSLEILHIRHTARREPESGELG